MHWNEEKKIVLIVQKLILLTVTNKIQKSRD